ncbi:hypothetical protein Thi970DRAFT_01472 [Thiorhodovibrio frisius]|uniref:Putative restriction endonuclease domain-containing protein n=1 Tax=Thiorhodovibrio frisius TaxID=631362 RepID=H8Z0H6_9GAMM|nr:Uma2 family endonuclease [Thiorhodovibrio frisius]EIC21277.1 hypothetical protein Thi970DRAFT_01472 [Thiorhodovibrio frisius]
MPVVEAEPTFEEARPIFRLGVDAYHQMIRAGIFDEDDRVELIEGELRAMTPINPDHAGKNKRLNRLLTLRVGDAALVSVQDPLTLAPRSEPEPDLMLLRPRDDFYEGANPTPADTLLVIEICDTSLGYDREVKVPLYAAYGCPRGLAGRPQTSAPGPLSGSRTRRLSARSTTRSERGRGAAAFAESASSRR